VFVCGGFGSCQWAAFGRLLPIVTSFLIVCYSMESSHAPGVILVDVKGRKRQKR